MLSKSELQEMAEKALKDILDSDTGEFGTKFPAEGMMLMFCYAGFVEGYVEMTFDKLSAAWVGGSLPVALSLMREHSKQTVLGNSEEVAEIEERIQTAIGPKSWPTTMWPPV